jgi:hypothetical protein
MPCDVQGCQDGLWELVQQALSAKGCGGVPPRDGCSNRVILQFRADNGEELLNQVALAVGLLPCGARGRLVVCFFGGGLFGLAFAGADKRRKAKHANDPIGAEWDPLEYDLLPKEIQKSYPESAFAAMGRLEPGMLTPDRLAAAKEIGLGVLKEQLKWAKEEMERARKRADETQVMINNLLALGHQIPAARKRQA